MGKRWENNNYCDIIPDVLFGVDLSNCCYNHDMAYWKKPITRKAADLRLKLCMQRMYRMSGKQKLGNFVSNIIYYGLRLLGWIRW